MGSEINVVPCHGRSMLLYGVEVWGDIVTHNAYKEIEKNSKLALEAYLDNWELNSQHPLLS